MAPPGDLCPLRRQGVRDAVRGQHERGQPSSVGYQYQGPAGQGIGFAPAFNLANYRITAGNFPTANVFIVDDLEHAD